MKIETEAWIRPYAPAGLERVTYASDVDGAKDWALAIRPARGDTWVVCLHGHGARGDQIFTRADMRDRWLAHYLKLDLGVLSPNLRGNAWMCPEAAADLHMLLDCVRRQYGARTFCFASGSMGATGNLIYATLHPQDVSLLAALCPVTDIVSYHAWLLAHPGGGLDEIRLAIESAYGGTPTQSPHRYAPHIAADHVDQLTMPLLLAHATGDATIPIAQSRHLHHRLTTAPNATYLELASGDHDTPLHNSGMLRWLSEQIQIERS